MSNATDDDERRRRSLEAGREMLEKYKAERASKSQGAGPSQIDEVSDEESFHNEKSIGHRESYAHEGISSRDITQSSVSMSEGEADGDLEGMAGRVVQLEELLQGKEAIVEALNAEFDHLRAEAPSPNSSQSQNSSIHSREIISLYHIKLQEFEKAVNERDNLIEDLTWRLQLALSARDSFASQLNALNAMEIPCDDNAVDNKSLQEKIDSLEETLNNQRSTIQKLNGQLTQIQEHVQTLEMEKETHNAEVNNYKSQIDDLNKQIRLSVADKDQNIAETLEQQKQFETRVDKSKQDMQQLLKKFTAETNANAARHQQELKDLSAKHETEVMNIQEKYEERVKQLKEENKSLADRLNKELPDLETRHAKELSIFQTQLVHYKKTVEALKLELMNRSESQQTAQAELNEYKSKLNELKVQSEKSRHVQDLDHQKEKEMLGEQIKLHKIQLEEITSKYLAATAVLESKESIERSLEQALTNAATLKDENESLKFKLDDLSSRYSAAQSLIENSQCHERTLTNRIFDLEKSLSRLSGINISTLSELNETTYQTMDDMAIQYQLTKQKLEEKAELEKLLVERIEGLEEDVRKSKEELEEANFTMKSCEKQLKDTKNTCDKYKSELNSLKKQMEESSSRSSQSVNDLLRKTEEDQQEIKTLKMSLEQKETELKESTTKMFELFEKLKKSEEECEQLKNGLAAAWAQCAEVEERLNQTLGLSESKLDFSVSSSSFTSALTKLKTDGTNNTANATREQSMDVNQISCEQIDDLNSSNRISSLQSKLSSVLEENDRLLKELEDYEEIRTKLRHYTALSENLATEKDRKTEENNALKKKLESMHSVQESVNQLRSEKDALRKEVDALICVHDEQISAIKAETVSEMRKVQSLMLGVKEGTTELNDLKNELEMRHAKEMEELRTYFEQKCLLMEKQYSEEIFSQQSKKMSDNDSEIADLTEGMYFGGGGDCLNVSNVSERSSRIASPVDEQSKQPGQNFDGKELENEMNIKALQHELQNKIIEVQELKLYYEKALEEQKNMYEREMYDSRAKEMREMLSNVSQHCQTEWDMEKGELARLRAAYDHQLEEQIARAKSDIVNALQEQIQALLNAEPDVEENWPAELLELRDKLTSNARLEIQLLKETHEQLRMTILELQRKLINAESKKETITEGYGENYDTGPEVTLQDFSQLQERARLVLSNGGGDCGDQLQLIEELCRQSDKLMEEAKREKEDLQKQVPLEPTPTPYIHRVRWRKIEAADKQLKATRRFLDEQASEREAERDETAKQIQHLQDQLKEREREKERDQRITSEPTLSPEESNFARFRPSEINTAVEILESQMKEMSSMMSDTEAKRTETESELKAAVDKIWVLREIITDLEYQVQAKTEKEESLKMQIGQLETVIAAQTKNQHELVQELDAIKMGSETKQLSEHINHLQEELRKHKLSTEQFNVNSAALKQMKSELRDMQNQLDKRIKDMESTHMCSSNVSLSHPSEDVSIRDQIEATRCPTPDDPTAPPMLPLDQLLKFKEKMMKHARVEEVALKRIKDLELQVNALKSQNEELQAEQEILQQTASEQLFQIEAMRGRLEQHKQSAPFAQRQATSRLEIQLHEANTKSQSLERAIAEKELELKDTRDQLDRVNQLLQEKEAEIANVVQMEGTTIQKLKQHVEVLEEDKKILLAKLGVQEHAQLALPTLIDSMLADKNEEIDHLKEQLSKKEKQLDLYSSLNLDESQLRELARQTEAKNSARTLSDILSIHSECEETVEAIRAMNTAQNLPNMSDFKLPTALASSQNMEESAMHLTDTSRTCIQVPLLDLGSQTVSESNQQSAIRDALHSGLDSKTSSENISADKTDHAQSWQENEKSLEMQRATWMKCTQTSVDEGLKDIEDLENRLQTIQEELAIKSAVLNKREADLNALHKLYNELQAEFKEVVDTLSRDKSFYQNQYELSRASENKIKKDLLEVENILKLKNEEIEDHKDKVQMNEKILMELKSENNRLKKDAEDREQEQMRKYASLLQEKMKELQNFRDAILEKDITIETIQTRNIEIENENKQLYEFKTKYQSTVQELLECQNEIQRLTEGLNNRDQIIRRLEEMARRSSFSDTSSPSNEKDQEIHHLQEYLKEKDKVIRQMSDDSKSLHRALETIQNKMKESGNVVELRKKLKDEIKLNTELRNMVDTLSKEVSELKLINQRSQDDTDIEDMVQRELNLSADLDRQILSAIESDADEKIEKQSLPYQEQELRMKLSQANKINEELKKIKDDLEIERGILKCQIAEYEGRIFQLMSDLMEESKKLAKLDEELSSEKNLVRTLKIQLEREHKAMHSGHVQDSELIEFLQSKLKTSLDNETKLRSDLSILRQEHKGMQIQLSLMKEQVAQSQKYDELPKLTDLLEAERKKHLSLMEGFEKVERENTELKDTLKKLQTEKNRLEKQLEVEMEEKEKLLSSLALSEELKDHMQTDLRRTKEELKLREDECEWLQKRIKTMSDAESRRQEQRTSEHNELKSLRREINNAREVMMDLEADMKQSKRELTESVERELKLAETLEAMKEKENELQKKLSSTKDVEKKLKDTIAELQQDLKASAKREVEFTKELKSRFADEKNVPTKFVQKIKDLSESNERYMTEKSALQEKLINVMSEKEQLNQRIKSLELQIKRNKVSRDSNIPSDYIEKLQHFYGKFLRADSRRKALTYQKRYLLTVIGGYQMSEENTMCVLAQLTKVERAYAVIERNKKSPRVRFRTAVYVLVSIQRMKWLIVRWNTGKRVGAKALLWNADHSFLPAPGPANVKHSPPVREKRSTNEDGALDGFVLQQYYQRLKNIQQTLGLAMSEAGQIIPE